MRIKKGFILRSIGGISTITSNGLEQVDFNKLISLNSSAAYLWKHLEDKEFDVNLISKLLVQKYNIPTERALVDAYDILEKWKNEGLIEL